MWGTFFIAEVLWVIASLISFGAAITFTVITAKILKREIWPSVGDRTRPPDKYEQEDIERGIASASRLGRHGRALVAAALWTVWALAGTGMVLLLANRRDAAGFLPWGLALMGIILLAAGAGLLVWVISPERAIRWIVLRGRAQR